MPKAFGVAQDAFVTVGGGASFIAYRAPVSAWKGRRTTPCADHRTCGLLHLATDILRNRDRRLCRSFAGRFHVDSRSVAFAPDPWVLRPLEYHEPQMVHFCGGRQDDEFLGDIPARVV